MVRGFEMRISTDRIEYAALSKVAFGKRGYPKYPEDSDRSVARIIMDSKYHCTRFAGRNVCHVARILQVP